MRGMAVALAAAMLGGCVAATAEAEGIGNIRSISYETGPCFGSCPVYRFTVGADGSGSFEGRQATVVQGRRSFTVTREQFQAFARHLAPVRPASGDRRLQGEACERTATDLPSTEVTWVAEDGARQQLYFYHGCDMEKNRALATRLATAIELLPLSALVGPPLIMHGR